MRLRHTQRSATSCRFISYIYVIFVYNWKWPVGHRINRTTPHHTAPHKPHLAGMTKMKFEQKRPQWMLFFSLTNSPLLGWQFFRQWSNALQNWTHHTTRTHHTIFKSRQMMIMNIYMQVKRCCWDRSDWPWHKICLFLIHSLSLFASYILSCHCCHLLGRWLWPSNKNTFFLYAIFLVCRLFDQNWIFF